MVFLRWVLGFGAWGLGSRVSGLGFRVWGFRFRISEVRRNKSPQDSAGESGNTRGRFMCTAVIHLLIAYLEVIGVL